MKYVENVIGVLIATKAHRATKYISDKQIIRATRRGYNNQIRKGENIDIVLTIGRPNFAERKFIKMCKNAGEPFPVRNIIIKKFKK